MKELLKNIISFCTTGHNDEVIVLLWQKLRTLPYHALLQIQDNLDGLSRDNQQAFGREVRDFVAGRILAFDAESDEPAASECFTLMYESVESMMIINSDYPQMSSSEVRRAYLEFMFAALSVYEFGTEMEERLIKTVYSVDAPSYRIIRNDGIVALVCRHPDKWEQIAELVITHNIRHTSALEALLEGHVKSSFGSGVL